MKKILSKVNVDYADIRYERKIDTNIVYNGKDLTDIGENVTNGYVVRVLKNEGFSSVAFTKFEDAEKAIKSAEQDAEILGKKLAKKVKLANVEVIKDQYIPELSEDPREVSIDEKLEIIKGYSNLALDHDKIINTFMKYFDITRKKYFVSTDGAEIKETLVTNGFRGNLVSKEGSLVQSLLVGGGGSDGFYRIRNRENLIEKRKKIAVDLLNADPIKGGTYNCILNPDLTAIFTHEAFGHFSEADLVENLPSIRQKMKIGSKLGSDILNIVDDPTILNQLGHYKYDDEGVRARRTQLMKNGELVGRLHSRRTAAEFDEPVTGHCVAEDYRYAPIVRMGTTYIEPGNKNFKNMLDELQDGLYVIDTVSGETSGENFTFHPQYGYIVENGKIKNMVRDINISGNLYKTLKNIKAVGDKLKLKEFGECGKGQINPRSCWGGPHLLINNLVVGGK